MFESIKVGWKLAKISLAMLMEDKKLLLFPFLSAIFAILLLIGFIIPFVITGVFSNVSGLEQIGAVTGIIVLFSYYLITSFFAIFFNVALVHSIKEKIEGEGEGIGSSIRFAFSRSRTILSWALLSAIVGMILKTIEDTARNVKGVGGFILIIIKGVIGFTWVLLTYFVVPVIVYQNLGVVDTIKKSGSILKQKWGEALFAGFSTGIMTILMIVAWVIVGIILIMVSMVVNPILGIIMAGIVFFGFLIILLISSAMGMVTRTLLFLYAEKGVLPPGLEEHEAEMLFRK